MSTYPSFNFANLKHDLPASIVVFFVALPLCLGIALASGAPLFSGVIAGVIGGIVVGMASGSRLGVSGPAAGLAVIVFDAIATLGSWELFLAAVVLAGVFQIVLGYIKAGFVAYFFPTSVITGMLTGIGLLIILKQLPFIFGYKSDYLGEESFWQLNGENSFIALEKALNLLSPTAIFISIVSLGILILWDKHLTKQHKVFELIQGPIVVVFIGIMITYIFTKLGVAIPKEQLVSLPQISSFVELKNEFTFADLSAITSWQVIQIAFVIAIVASIETLLSVEATDKLDPEKKITPTNRELKAQGLGNMISGLIGGLPITQVIVRSSANITFGAKSKMSAILHGFFLIISVMTIVPLLNMIPLASLAAILIVVGYKLTNPSMFLWMYRRGFEQFVPFSITVIAMLVSDLLTGVILGLVASILFTLHHSYRNSYHLKDSILDENGVSTHHIVLAEEVSFFNKANLLKALNAIPENSKVILDFSNTKAVAYDVVELVKDYITQAQYKNIQVQTVKFQYPEH